MTTGAPYGHLFEPFERGCHGGAGSGSGGRGGGVIWLTVHDRLQVDGEVSCNGEPGSGTGGGGSGGSVLITTHLIQVRYEQVTGKLLRYGLVAVRHLPLLVR